MKIRAYKKYSMLLLGVLLSAYPVVAVLRPNGLMTGGITGLARIMETILTQKTTIDPNLLFNISYYLLAIIVLILAFAFLGKKDGMKIIVMTFIYPLALFVLTYLDIPALKVELPVYMNGQYTGVINDLLIPAIAYGVLGGVGTGFIVRSGFTSGGSDTIAKILYKRVFPYLSIGVIIMFVDGLVIASSIFFFDVTIMAYAFITKFVYIRSVDIVVFGMGNNRVKVEILSQESTKIQEYIMNTLHRGVTIIDSEGGYSHAKGKQIICICTPRESLLIKNFIARIDPKAFVYIIKINSIWGRGFKSIVQDDLANED